LKWVEFATLLQAVLFPCQGRKKSDTPVVVTGVGIITAMGRGWNANADGFRVGARKTRPVSLFDVSRHRVKVAAEITMPEAIPTGRLRPNAVKRLDRASQLLLVAADEAWRQARLDGTTELPVVLGTTSGGMALGQTYYRQAIEHPRDNSRQAARVLHYLAQTQAMVVEEALGFHGPITVIANACASGSNAIGHAGDLIRSGQSEIVLTGGYDALSELVFTGFDSLQALSPTECRPFDANRDGLALGEGAAVLILESEEHARRRGAEALATLAGYGAATDCHHLTQPQPEGNAALQSMRLACEDAGLTPRQINYVNAHGTGTPLNDSAEAAAINRWAEDAAADIPVSSSKACIGHLLGAAGAVEAAICIMALQGQWLPPMNIGKPDPACNFPLVCAPSSAPLVNVLSNSFGFGGANATLIFSKNP
jgi:3-oxoacyl-[acyl-carrier-protein] synthase II